MIGNVAIQAAKIAQRLFERGLLARVNIHAVAERPDSDRHVAALLEQTLEVATFSRNKAMTCPGGLDLEHKFPLQLRPVWGVRATYSRGSLRKNGLNGAPLTRL